MSTTDYLTSAALKDTLSMSGETFADADIALAITSASRAVDSVCQRRFWLDSDATQIRYYQANSRSLLEIDDLVQFTSLETDSDGDGTFEETWTVDVDFVFEPLNAAADTWPYETIRKRKTGQFALPRGIEKGVKLTGQFGWAAVPSNVQSAAGLIAARLMRRAREAPFGVIGFGMDVSNAVMIARTDPDVTMLLADYVRTLMR